MPRNFEEKILWWRSKICGSFRGERGDLNPSTPQKGGEGPKFEGCKEEDQKAGEGVLFL